MIFQSLAARYTLGSALQHMITTGSKHDSDLLRMLLAERYGGTVTLYGKGRAALAEAVQQATGGKGAVAVNGLTCISVPQAVEAEGCVSVYVDIEKNGVNMDPVQLEKAAKRHTLSAVIVQNTLGYTADIKAIEKIAKEHNMVIIEDLAHCAGARYEDGREVGTVGQYTMLSFGRDKALDAMNGGALIDRSGSTDVMPPTQAPAFLSQLRDRIYPLLGWKARTLSRWKLAALVLKPAYALGIMVRSADGPVAIHERMPHWQARLALLELQQLPSTVKHRQAVARHYMKQLAKHGIMPYRKGSVPIRCALLVGAEKRSDILGAFTEQEMHVGDAWYDVPVGPRRYFAEIEYPNSWCPVTVDVASRILNIPTHTGLTGDDVKRIIRSAQEVLR